MASFKGFVEGLTGVASEVGSHLLDPSGKKRGTVAYEELINSMQPALAKEVLDYERNTRFWVEHDAMLKRTKRSATDWRNAKLENELLILKDFYKDTDYTFDIAAEKDKLKNSLEFQARLDQYENLMNKGKQYEIKIEDLKTEKGRELNRAKHIGPIQARMEALGREIYKNYGLKGDIKAILGNMGIGKGDERSLTEVPLGNSNFNVLLPEAADSIELKRLNSIVKAIEGEGINNLDLTRMRTAQEDSVINPTLTLRDPEEFSKLLYNAKTETTLKSLYNVQASAKDSSFPEPKSDADKLFLGGDYETPAEVLHTLYNQSLQNLSPEDGKNSYTELFLDHQQIAALIANIGTDEKYGINIVDNYTEISLAAWDLLKDRIVDKERPGLDKLYYNKLTNNEKINLINQMPELLEKLQGNKTQISKFVPEMKKAMKGALQVTSRELIQQFETGLINSNPITSETEALNIINSINNPDSWPSSLTNSDRDYLITLVQNKFLKDTEFLGKTFAVKDDTTTDFEETSENEFVILDLKDLDLNLEVLDDDSVKNRIESFENPYKGMSQSEIQTAIYSDINKGKIRTQKPFSQAGENAIVQDINKIINAIVESSTKRVESARENPRIKALLDKG
jgi:hypothetical protein